MPEDDLAKASPNKVAVLAYFKQGGLSTILPSNLVGGQNQPRVWLTLDSRGKVMPTFTADRGMIGGEPVPVQALNGDRIFAAKEEEVVTFLQTFGLTRTEAVEVIRSVGIVP